MTDTGEHGERNRQGSRTGADDAEPVRHELGTLDETLEAHEYPTTKDELIAAYGDHEVESQRGWTTIRDVLAPIDDETYDSADEVRTRIQALIHRG